MVNLVIKNLDRNSEMIGGIVSNSEIHFNDIDCLVNLGMSALKELFLNSRNGAKNCPIFNCRCFNANVFGLFYNLSPNSSIGPSKLAGKEEKAASHIPGLFE